MPDADPGQSAAQSSKRILIDTNILIYSTLADDSRFEIARSVVLGRYSRNDVGPEAERFVSVQNIAEMYPNLTGPKMMAPDSPATAMEKIISIASLSTLHVLPLTFDIQRIALELCRKYEVHRQRFFDMQIAATMVAHRIGTLITENTGDFEDVEDIRILNPFAA